MADSVDFWLGELGYDALPGVTIRREDGCPADRAYSTEVRAMFDDDQNGLAASAFVCLEQTPTIALVDHLDLSGDPRGDRDALRAFCERLWNQNLVRVVLVARPSSFDIWSVDDPEANYANVQVGETRDVRTWSLAGIAEGLALDAHGGWFEPEKRVDRTLLASIQQLVKKLRLEAELDAALARELIARIIFVAYLEDRHIVSDEYRLRNGVDSLYELLSKSDGPGLDRLFDQLQLDFNGDFLRPLASGSSHWAQTSKTAMSLLHEFLGRTVLRSGQRDFWRYNFKEMPIELIAGVYETFLASKDDEKAVEEDLGGPGKTKRQQGAYYTPRLLAEALVDMAFDGREPLDQIVFDGACGSGMLLTAAYRRLIRAQLALAERDGLGESAKGFEARKAILQERIFGADIDEDACRLTSFSLYLALLSDLTPSDLAVLRAGGHKLPSLMDNIQRGERGDFLSADNERANAARFTVTISNPPWRKVRDTDVARQNMAAWLRRQTKPHPVIPEQELSAAFTLAAASTLKVGGRVALLLPINLLLSTERKALAFRMMVLSRLRVRRIVNFADMRYLIFDDARHPFVVLIADLRQERASEQDVAPETFNYETPKADMALAYGALGLHGDDVVKLPALALLDPSGPLSFRYWGDARDLQLFRRLCGGGRVKDLLTTHGWVAGKGFHVKDDDVRRDARRRSIQTPDDLKWMPFVHAKNLDIRLPHIPNGSTLAIPFGSIARVPQQADRLFDGPRVLWPDGANPIRGVKSIYVDTPLSFQHSVGVISAPETDDGRLLARFLATYMRSTLGRWLSLLLSPSVSTERAKLHLSELKEWPFWTLDEHPDPRRARAVLKHIDAILRQVEELDERDRSGRLSTAPILLEIERDEAPRLYEKMRAELDQLVFDYFEMPEDERALIGELATILAPAVQPAGLGYRSLAKPARLAPTERQLDDYATSLTKEMERWRDVTFGSGHLRTWCWTASKVPLGAAILEIGESEEQNRTIIGDDRLIAELAAALHRVAKQSDCAFLRVPNLTIVEGARILIVKPLIARYWLKRAATADAGRIAHDLQALARQPASPRQSSNSESNGSSA